MSCEPSRFLDEMPDELLERYDNEERSEENNVIRGSATLTGLRNLLG